MVMEIDYIDYEQALKIYYKTVEKSGGGMAGVRVEATPDARGGWVFADEVVVE